MRILMWEHFAPGGPIRVGGHHVARRFLRDGSRVAWCAGPISPLNFLKSNAETRARMRLWRLGGEVLEGGKMFAYAPMTLLPHRPYPLLDSARVQRRTLQFTVPRFGAVLGRAGFERVDILWMSPGSPFLALLDEVPHDLAVYRMSDDTTAFPDAPRGFTGLEAEACRRCDLVLATARRLEARARSLGAKRVHFMPNACDPEPFKARGLPEPEEFRHLPRPRALYAGAIDWWFDTELVAGVARALPDWCFILLGPVRADLSSLRRLPNVVVLGPRPYAALPGYMGNCDAGLVPFRLAAMTQAIHPIKVYEYCAAGLPVVATPMEETAAMGAPLRLARDAAGFARALQEGLSASPGERDSRMAFARANTWDHRFKALMGAIGTTAEAAAPRAARGGR